MDNGIGDYTLNFITALTDADYAVLGTAGLVGIPATRIVVPVTPTPSSLNIHIFRAFDGVTVDVDYISIALTR